MSGGKVTALTGATGFVGAYLARHLLEQGHEVHLLVRPEKTPWRLEGIAERVTCHTLDMYDRKEVAKVVGTLRPQWVFNLMAHGAYSSQTDPFEMVRANLLATMHLMEAAVDTGAEALVQAGSSSEYGFKDHPPKETDGVFPNSHYAVTKAAASQYLQLAAKEHGFRAVTLRLYSIYGPYEEPTRLIPALVVQGLAGRLPPLVNPGIARDFVYVQDAARAFVMAAQNEGVSPGAIFNVGTGGQTTLRELVSVAQEVLPIEQEPQWGTMQNRAWDTTTWVSDNTLAKTELGFEPRVGLKEGLSLMRDWFTRNPALLAHYRRCLGLPEETLPIF